jgi:hypothetical protein
VLYAGRRSRVVSPALREHLGQRLHEVGDAEGQRESNEQEPQPHEAPKEAPGEPPDLSAAHGLATEPADVPDPRRPAQPDVEQRAGQ